MARLIAIGDIHGELNKLNRLLDKIVPAKEDTVVFLGDYIDVGENTKGVIERLIELKNATDCIFLMGNHEKMFLKWLKTKNEKDLEQWLMLGGYETFQSYDKDFPDIYTKHLPFFLGLKLYYKTDDYFFVHAGVRPDKPLEEQEKEDLLWIRDNFIYKKHILKQKVIFGHTPFYEPYIEDDKIGINTGCGIEYDGRLTALICGEETFITV